MRITILIIILTISALKLFPQDGCDCSNGLALKAMNERLFGTVIERTPDPGQFYYEEWRKGSVLLINGKTVTEEFLKYNGFLDKFFVYKPVTGKLVILNDEKIKEVNLIDHGTGETNRFIRNRVKNPYAADSVDTYLEVLTTGPNSLYARRRMEYFPASHNYKPATRYYVSMSDLSMHQVDPRNKNFPILTGKTEEVLKTQLRKARLNIKRERDFIQVVNLYNELLKTGSGNE
jgi:hypothetical protein